MNKLGIFGGSFNPLHLGHINSVVNVAEKMSLDKIIVVPAYQNPLKEPIEGPSPEQRLKMAQIGFEEYKDFVEVDSIEIERQGKSYTVDTIQKYIDEYSKDSIFLILGIDTFYSFDNWKDFDQILNMVNLIVTSRPGNQLPFSVSDFPKGLQPYVAAFDRRFIQLTTGMSIEFIRIEDIDISATELRKKIRNGLKVEKFLTYEVESFIQQEELYKPLGAKIDDYEGFTSFCAQFLNERGAIGLRAFDLKDVESPSDYTMIASGTSTKHAGSLAQTLIQEVKSEYAVLPISVEGINEGRWCLLDYGALIIHIFYDFVRQEYGLETLWREGKELKIKK